MLNCYAGGVMRTAKVATETLREVLPESMTEQHRFEMAAARALLRLETSGKEFTQKDLLHEAQREFEESEARLGQR